VSDENGARGDDDVTPDEFAHLFRTDDLPGEEAAPSTPANPPPDQFDDDWEPLVAIPVAGRPAADIEFDDSVSPEPPDPPLPPPIKEPSEAQPDAQSDAQPESGQPVEVVDPKEGRLFRSRGAPEIPEAITAVSAMQARRLSTLSRSREDGEQPPPEWAAEPAPLPVAASGEPAPALQVMATGVAPAPPVSRPTEDERKRRDRKAPGRPTSGSLTGLGVYAVTIGVTVILAFGETLFFGGEPGIITGIGLFAISVFAAFAVRTTDAISAVFAPAIAFFVAAATAGQMDINANDTSGRLVALFFLLGGNWVWIIGSTAAALVIVALRRRFS
jgi:hypothetical protein